MKYPTIHSNGTRPEVLLAFLRVARILPGWNSGPAYARHPVTIAP